ncbi:methionyl-tRNA formyltransferase [Helicobacter turcicus]|uniref:Methionyl-tRNA formyltransferase n=1 Tax=Helicobacter turcicus TaxID=2867412 RepID=A0ABS7JL04_9HELI|nr:methionyl-tRNA formyltransferase [Helicobacter turcicus]MBX7490080.1 methionyl-tRNA formyltransferase [Helicobacter turcicus]MBX7544939.1 methionyl-tRNA formyltransferase [Helicobacter turcicus]
MQIIFMGTPNYAAVILDSLLRHHTICALVCQRDKRAGRSMQLKAPATKELLQLKAPSIPIFQPECLDDVFVEELKALKPDIIIVAAFGKVLPKAVLGIAPCVNLHASILPKFRGASAIQQSILEAESYFGVSVMQMEENLDCGDILGFKVIENTGQNAVILFDVLAKLAAELILEYLERISIIRPLAQNNADASYCKKIRKEFGLVEFDNSKTLENKALAYSGWPEVYLKSGLKLKTLKLDSINGTHKKGEILEIAKNGIKIGCEMGSVWITTLQAPSKKAVGAYEYAQGKRLKVGDILE